MGTRFDFVTLERKTGTMNFSLKTMIAALLLTGCAGLSRDCSSCGAQNFGGDWIVVQYRFDGAPINCWQMRNTPISNESASDGIYWQDTGGHLVHISGWHNRVQVQGERWDEAAKALGIDRSRCNNGVYLARADAGSS